MRTTNKKVKLIEIKSEDVLKKFNFYKLGRVISKKEFPNFDHGYLFELDITSSVINNRLYKIRFCDLKLMKFFISKLSKANFKRKRMELLKD